MQRTRISIMTVLMLLMCGVVTADTIKIASWNIENFSLNTFNPEDEDDPDLEHVVDILQKYQVIAIQEVSDDQIIGKTVDYLKKRGHNYGYKLSDPVGERGYQERYAFLYDRAWIKLPKNEVAKIYAGEKAGVLERDPYYVTFETLDERFDFTLVTFHAVFEEKKRSDEVEALAPVFTEIRQEEPNDKDIILLGDFNFDPARDEGHYPHKGAYNPLLGITKMALHPPLKSLVSGRGLVDNIFYDEDYTQEYTLENGVDKFDKDLDLSDHYLIWAEFEIPLRDNDEPRSENGN